MKTINNNLYTMFLRLLNVQRSIIKKKKKNGSQAFKKYEDIPGSRVWIFFILTVHFASLSFGSMSKKKKTFLIVVTNVLVLKLFKFLK